jgi:hypothetical protein
VLTAAAAFIGVPAVFIGLALVAFVMANPVTWFLAGAVWFGLGFRHYRHQLTIRDTPLSKIGAAAIGLVEVTGRVHSDTSVTAPLSSDPCIFWKVSVEAYKDDNLTKISEYHSSASSFEIDDGTGRVLIWAWDSDVIVTSSKTWQGSADELEKKIPPGRLRDSLKHISPELRHGLVMTERRIELGATLYVMGTLSERLHVTTTSSFRERVQDRFRPKPSNPAGATTPTALDAAKMFGLAIVMVVGGLSTGRVLWLPPEPPPPPPDVDPHQVLIWRGNRDRPFIIADSAEGIVIETLTRWTKLALLGGAGVMAGTVVLYLGGFFS